MVVEESVLTKESASRINTEVQSGDSRRMELANLASDLLTLQREKQLTNVQMAKKLGISPEDLQLLFKGQSQDDEKLLGLLRTIKSNISSLV